MQQTLRTKTTESLAALIALLLIQSIGLAQTPQVKLEEGTEVRLKLMEAINSGTAQSGQTVSFQVLDEVKVGEVVVIKEGATAWGTIVEARGKRSLGRSGKLALRVDYVKAVDGSKVPLRAATINQGKGRGATAGIAAGATAVFFWPAAPFFLLMKGTNAEIPRGQHIPAFVDGDRMIKALAGTMSAGVGYEINGAPALTPAGLSAATPARSYGLAGAELGTVNIISDARGAEVEVDGAYYGNTPGSLKLAAGLHTITVRYAGGRTWQRTLNVTPGSNLTVQAELMKPVMQPARRNDWQ